jgi:selenocysteine lyase/cysteine desulfurase
VTLTQKPALNETCDEMLNLDLLQTIRDAVIGEGTIIETSFGAKPLIYADYTASGRSLTFIEDYIRHQVLPFYANTHTETSFTGAQTTKLREQARQIIHKAVKGNDDDQVIFCGSGATAAINKLIDILNLRLPADLDAQHQLLDKIPLAQRPVVFIGPYEHHSNELPWRESIADVVVIPLNASGQIDISILNTQLTFYSERALKIGSFSAASNVTGVKSDVDLISQLLHQHNAYALWDYAAAAPYVGIDMNATKDFDNDADSQTVDCSKDAVFISPHKFVGGPGSPGILVVKKHLLSNSVPSMPGGGTVMYVTPDDHQFIDDHEHREEGGTPAIIESIRAGLAVKLQQEVGTDNIEALEKNLVTRALQRWSCHDNIDVLGCEHAKRLSIVSLRIKHQNKDLHYAFVVALLNDLFGIQARGGCSCAGPYGHTLLNMDMVLSKAIETELGKGHLILRPGWVRLNFNYFIDDSTFEYLVSAIEMIAKDGWQLLPYYCFDKASGTWRYQMKQMDLSSDLNEMRLGTHISHHTPEVNKRPLQAHLNAAATELNKCRVMEKRYDLCLTESVEALRWFTLPQDIDTPSLQRLE